MKMNDCSQPSFLDSFGDKRKKKTMFVWVFPALEITAEDRSYTLSEAQIQNMFESRKKQYLLLKMASNRKAVRSVSEVKRDMHSNSLVPSCKDWTVCISSDICWLLWHQTSVYQRLEPGTTLHISRLSDESQEDKPGVSLIFCIWLCGRFKACRWDGVRFILFY